MSRRFRLAAALAAGLLLVLPTAAFAAPLDLGGASSATTGKQVLKLKGVGKTKDDFAVNVAFDTGGPGTFTAVQPGSPLALTGTYKQKGSDGRKLRLRLDNTSRAALRLAILQALEELIVEETGMPAVGVQVSLEKIKLKGKIKNDGSLMKLKGKIRVSGSANDIEGKAIYKIKSSGPLAPGS